MVKGVTLLGPVLREEAVTQGVIAHDVLDLQGSRRGRLTQCPSFACSSRHSTNTEQHRPFTRPCEGFGGGLDRGLGLGTG